MQAAKNIRGGAEKRNADSWDSAGSGFRYHLCIPSLAVLRRCWISALTLVAIGLSSGFAGDALAQLAPADLDRLHLYGEFWEFADADFTRLAPERQRQIGEATERARREFGGRGVDVADYFLKYTDHTVRNEAYWFVLGALADVRAATLLIRALPQPPTPVVGIVPRDQAEIRIALETMLAAPAIAESDEVARELIKVIEERSPRSGPPDIAIALLGKSRTPFARAVLTRLLADPAAQIRSLAAQALGEGAVITGGTAEVPFESLSRVLEGDRDPQARAAAAMALGRVASGEAVAALTRAIDREQTPQVVDAIIAALEQRGTPITDPERCRTIVERSWELQSAQNCFARWRAVADDAALIEAAANGAPVLRILAIRALIERPAQKRLVGDGSAASSVLDAGLRDRLLTSLSELLSTPAGTMSSLIAWMAHQAVWDVSGHDVATAFPYVDSIGPLPARFAALTDLASRDAEAYARARRPTQLRAAAAIVVAGLGLALVTGMRGVGIALLLSALAWALWTLQATSVRELPPPTLMLLTVPAIALLGGGVVAGLASWLGDRWRVTRLKRVGLSAAAAITAGFAALVIAGWSRNTPVFPADGGGFATIFEPIGAAVLATVWATFVLAILAVVPRPASAAQSI